ncbi:diguanylate cyclase [Paraglaciecola sp.]|uniref:diguanylate cyclase n=1 Tax=Paraglaciecola sp. TaxID=1920173 RepID=UPI0030F42FC7
MLRSLILCSVLILSAVTKAQQVQIIQLSEPYAGYAVTLVNSPQKVVDMLTNSAPDFNQPDIIHAQYHFILAQAYYNLTYPQKSLNHAQSSLKYVSGKNQSWLYHSCKVMEAVAFELVGTPMQGMAGVNAAIDWAQHNNQPKLYLQALFSKGIIQTSLTNYVAALDNFQHAYMLASNDPNELSKAHVAAMLAQVYEYRHEDSLAIPYFEEAVAAHRINQADLDLSIALYGLGKANINTGKVKLGETQLAESAQLAEKVEDIQGVGYALKELAAINMLEKNYIESERKLLKAADIFAQATNPQMNFNIMLSLVKLAIETNDIVKADAYLKNAENLLDRANMPIHSIGFDEVHASVLYEQGYYQLAYDGLKQAFQTHKKYQNTESTGQLHQLRSRFEVQVAQHENQALSQQNTLQQLQLSNKKNQNMQLILITAFTTIVCGLLGILVFRNKVHKLKLEKLATRDELTGLVNRRHTLALLEQQMSLAARHDKRLCIAMVDLDWFKQVNDAYGHVAGDNVLREFALLCKKSLRESDVVGRIGGEEFLLILSRTTLDDAYKVLDSLRLKMRGLSKTAGIPKAKVTISIGVVEYKQDDSIENFILLADTALYRAKNNGRDQVVVCDRNICVPTNLSL